MPKEQSPGKTTTRRYSPEEKAASVRMVRTLRAELGTEHRTVQRVARQLGYGIESVRSWVRRADIGDGYDTPPQSSKPRSTMPNGATNPWSKSNSLRENQGDSPVETRECSCTRRASCWSAASARRPGLSLNNGITVARFRDQTAAAG